MHYLQQALLLMLLLVITSCSYPPGHINDKELIPAEQKVQSSLNDTATNILVKITNSYIELKNAFVMSDATEVNRAAGKMSSQSNSLLTYLRNDSTIFYSLLPYVREIMINNNELINARDETCELKRVHFKDVSESMFGLLKATAFSGPQIYKNYCPMAFNDAGASWLSTQKKIYNPYFGQKMLECGEITDSLN